MIISAGLTPAWQTLMRFNGLDLGEVNRSSFVAHYASGKVLNVAVALCHLDVSCKAISVVGGPARELVDREFSGLGISRHWVASRSATRTCVTLLDDATGATTELVENAGPISENELQEFIAVFAHDAEHADAVVLTGSLPKDTRTSIYEELTRPLSCPIVLDARGPELLAAVSHRPWIVKPNREELAATLRMPLENEANLKLAMQELVQLGAQRVLVSDGAKATWFLDGKQFYQLIPPRIDDAVNPIGSGDCLAAGIAAALTRGNSSLDCVIYGMAVAAENVRQLLAGRIDAASIPTLVEEVQILPQ